MAGPRRAGGIARRCECRGDDGRRLGQKCPQLSKRNHGTYHITQELPLSADGRRRRFRRVGYTQSKEAQADLDKIRALLDLADDEHQAQQVGDLCEQIQRERAPIPDAAEVRRRLGGGVPLSSDMTVGDWLGMWLAGKKTKRRTTSGYESHIRVHLRPGLGHYRLDRLNVGHVQRFFDGIDERNEVVRAENAARREQEARCRWRPGTKGGAPPPEVSARLAVEREKLAAMPPYRLVTGPATKQRIRSTLRAALNGAIRAQLITFNAAEWVELESGKRPKARLWTEQSVEHWRSTGEAPSPVMVWTLDQLGRFLDEAESSSLYSFFQLIAFRGLRRGEGVGLAWRHVDLDAGVIIPAKTLVVDRWEVYEDDPKTEEAASPIGLDSLNIDALRERRRQQLAERDAWNRHAAEQRAQAKDVADWADTGKVWTEPDGTWLHPEKVSGEFRRIRKRAGLPPISLRDLRHLAATLVYAASGDIHAVKTVLRHASVQLTSGTYTEVLQDVDREIAERAAGLVPRARRSAESALAGGGDGGEEGAGEAA